MKSKFLLIGMSTTIGLVGCNTGSNNPPSNAFTEFYSSTVNNTEAVIVNYTLNSNSSTTCTNLINNAYNAIFQVDNVSGNSWSYSSDNSSAKLCSYNNANCLSSNNTNTPCISGTQTLSPNSDGSAATAATVVWNQCTYSNTNSSPSFSANLTITQGATVCNGTVTGTSQQPFKNTHK